ncbi:MAG TPA: hypothetical protein VI873_00030 [Candidatus Peribacteraceae bacterium]|nr:hypothetical protein [Candidatus Peribacteraceae bacterium]
MTARMPLIRLITVSLFTAVLAGTWDVWWHGAIGRETFWSPPHLLLYASVIVAIETGFYGWWKTREQSWKWLAIVLFLVPASAPFDELWHRIFGVEQINSSLIVWSPPHVVLALALIGSFLFLFVHLRKDEDVIARHLLQSAALASALSLLVFLASPLEPIGPYHLIGYSGAAIGSGIIVAIFLFGQEWMRRFGSATSVAGIFMLLAAMNFGEKMAPNLPIQPHDHPPGWLMIFSCLVPAALIDLLQKRPLWLRGGIVGGVHAGILYGFSSRFFEQQFQYGIPEMWTAIIASAIAGIAVGIALPFSKPKFFPSFSSL